MSKNSASKTIGKIVSLIILILLLGVIAVTWFIGGQTKAIEKYCAAHGCRILFGHDAEQFAGLKKSPEAFYD